MDPIKWKIERQWKVIAKQQEKPQGTLKGGGWGGGVVNR